MAYVPRHFSSLGA